MRGVLLLSLAFLPGCLLGYRGLEYKVEFTSSPAGARVEFNGASGITPCQLTVPRSAYPRMARFTLDDCVVAEAEIAVTDVFIDRFSMARSLYVCDVFFLIPAIVDYYFPEIFVDGPTAVRATMKHRQRNRG